MKGSSSYVFTERFLNYKQVQRVIAKGGCKALGILYMLCRYLRAAKGAVGLIEDIKNAADDAKMYERSMRKWMEESKLFVIDDEYGIFYCRTYRHFLGMPDNPSEEEMKIINRDGNTYESSSCETYRRRKEQHARNKEESKYNVSKNKEESSKNESLNSQISDNKDFKLTPYRDTDTYTDTDISLQSSENTDTHTTSSELRKSGGDDDDGFDFFRKNLFLCTKWRKYASLSFGINLCEDETMDIFARWMHGYCTAKMKDIGSIDEILRYASNLLLKGQRTRKMFDDFMKSEQKIRHEQNRHREDTRPEHFRHADYEHKKDGLRYSCFGEILPREAPPQPSAHVRWSYFQEKWVDADNYDTLREWTYGKGVMRRKLAQYKAEKEAEQAAIRAETDARLAAEEKMRESDGLNKKRYIQNYDKGNCYRSVCDRC